MNYLSYTIEDFLTDETFLNYCKKSNGEDLRFWNELKAAHPGLSAHMEQAEQLFLLLSVAVDPEVKAQELQKLKDVIEASANTSDPDTSPVKVFSRVRLAWFSAAAAILLCIGTYTIIQQERQKASFIPQQQSAANAPTYTTGVDERRKVTLADGTSVVMNALSTIVLDEHYNEHNRILWLNGEAHFEVSKNKEKPFIVITGKTATTALGTSFKINNYHTEGQLSIMLGTGKVSVGRVSGEQVAEKLQLVPGQMARVSDDQDQYTTATFDLSELDNWTSRRLHFSAASLKTIKAMLKQTYGVDISSVNQPKKPIAFTGSFENESLTEVLTAIGFSNHFTYTINKDHVVLTFAH